MASFSRSAIQFKNPVPSDIEISQSITPQPINFIADAAGLTPDEYDLYGKTKAKNVAIVPLQ